MNPNLTLLTALLLAPLAALHAGEMRYTPDWAGIAPKRVIEHTAPDGEALVQAVAALRPGDRLVIASGTYSVGRLRDIRVSGTAEAPIWIVGEEGARVVITRPDERQNVLNSVIHNTMINTGHAFAGGSWNGREGMVLANNILYSRDKNAMHFPNGHSGVIITGNVIVGGGPKVGATPGRGLEDFARVTWDGEHHDTTPAESARFQHADARYLLETDFTGIKRTKPFSGARTP